MSLPALNEVDPVSEETTGNVVSRPAGLDYPTIELPEELADCTIVASVSGGKDSTALMLALREAGIPFRAVFADTGWEAAETYAYLGYLVERLGIWIDRVAVDGGMVGRARYRAGFPGRMQRWCTSELKLYPLADYHHALMDAEGVQTANAVGVRGEESAKRMGLAELEPDHPRGRLIWTWRPLMSWTVQDVLKIHLANEVKVNPLYRQGFERVGCWPCIFSRKDEIRRIAEHDPGRIDEIRALEGEFTQLRASRNADKPGRYSHPVAAFFQTRDQKSGPMTIDEVVTWSRTSRGGRQLELIDDGPQGGCMRWGLCEAHNDDEAGDE